MGEGEILDSCCHSLKGSWVNHLLNLWSVFRQILIDRVLRLSKFRGFGIAKYWLCPIGSEVILCEGPRCEGSVFRSMKQVA